MPERHFMTPLRGLAAQTIATNARLLETGSGPQRAESPLGSLQALPGGVAEGIDKALEPLWPEAADKASRWGKGLARAHLKGVGVLGDVAELAAAEDKGRAAAGIAGGRLGGFLGGLVPGAEPVTVPLGAVVGNWAGHELYDHKQDIKDFVDVQKANLADQLGRELTHYAPYDLPDRLMRR